MRRIMQASIIVLMIILIAGCKKDSSTDDIKLYGLWQVNESVVTDNLKFLNFKNNKTVVSYSISEDGFKSTTSSVFSPSTDQFIGTVIGTGVLNYTVEGDLLTIKGGNDIVYLKATRSTSVEPDSWVTEVTSTDHIDNLFTENNRGIGYDGSNLLFTDYTNGEIIKVSLATRSIASQVSLTNSLNTVEYDGTDYWVAVNGYDQIKRYSTAGNSIATSIAMGPWIYGIGYVSPTSIICYSNNAQTLYNYNPVTNSVTNLKEVGISLRDIAISNGKTYVSSNDMIYRLNSTTFAVEKSYRVTNAGTINGIASVGNNVFWLNINDGEKILKVELN